MVENPRRYIYIYMCVCVCGDDDPFQERHVAKPSLPARGLASLRR
jgi:hypothetical protein